ncbi:DUF4399 domain-containing protein [Rehaibacterium terrae]|jgi:hypothetical protein|uniref:DUF4399 domain-containing protein n=1 Tax=Rehaibacterium terrae TaxID=1341696 RepID=A0A7W7Y0G6_9GAMM|nr:DUF4399 domain-containing protein [Rehaibacterium terrae]MBB5015807.1 hypothetical protein [Rehaibacterium terrae]
MRLLTACLFFAALSVAAAGLPRSSAPAEARLYFISPQDGDSVDSEFTVRFGLSGMGVAPAGVVAAHTGHHHLLIDTDLPPLDRPIPNDARHLHFGQGQTEATIRLPPGRHTLQLLLGDHAHIPHDPPVISERITVIVRD